MFLISIPNSCSDRELEKWVKSHGFESRSVRTVRDLVVGTPLAFGYVELRDETQMREAITVLDGKKIRGQTVSVRELQLPKPTKARRR